MASDIKEKLRETAIELFQQYGFKQISINKICEKAGVSKTTFYFHYKSKHDLILQFYYQSNMDSLLILNRTTACDSIIEQLWAIFYTYCKQSISVGTSIMREILQEYLNDKEAPILPDNTFLKEPIKNLLERGVENGEFRKTDSLDNLYETLICITNGAAMNWIMSDGEIDLIECTKKAIYELLLH